MEPTEKHKLINTKLPLRILMILLICMADIAWSATVLYAWENNGTVISVKAASDNIPGIFMQNLIVSAVPILLFIICLIVLKKPFFDQMYFKVYNKKQVIIIAVLSAILILLALYCLVTKADKITVLYNLLYYTVFIALTEEFVVRDVCTYLLRAEKSSMRYLIPNVPFAAMHIFSYAGWGTITLHYLITFVFSQMLGLVAMGCIFQFLKEKSGTIWVPVLVHAILDFSVVLGYK